MSYKLKKKLTKINYTPMSSKKNSYIVLHYTGNHTDTAAGNANYFYIQNRGASAHYFVDGEEVYRVVRDKDAAWSVGKNYGDASKNLFLTVKNHNSINIEMCSSNGKITKDTFENSIRLTKKLMKKYNIPASHVVRHFDVCSKACPGWKGWGTSKSSNDASIWNDFLTRIQIQKPASAIKPTSKEKYIKWLQYKLGMNISGKWDAALEKAVISYKRKNGLAGTNGKICGLKMIQMLTR